MKEIKMNGVYYFVCVDVNHTCYDYLDDIIDSAKSFIFESAEDLAMTSIYENAEELRLALQKLLEDEIEEVVNNNFYEEDDFELITTYLGLDFPNFEEDEDYDEDGLKESLSQSLINSVFVTVCESPIQ